MRDGSVAPIASSTNVVGVVRRRAAEFPRTTKVSSYFMVSRSSVLIFSVIGLANGGFHDSGVPDSFHVDDFANYYVDALHAKAPALHERLRLNLLPTASGAPAVTWASAFAGTDSIKKWFPALLTSMRRGGQGFTQLLTGDGVIRQVFMCENDDKKIKFMKANLLYEDIGYHFCDSCKLGLKKARGDET